MASRADLEMLIKAHDEASSVLGKIEKAIGGVAKIAAGFVVGTALTKLPDLLMSAAQAAADDEASIKKLQTAITNAGDNFKDYEDQLNKVIKSGQRKGETDDQIRDSLSLLTAQTGDTGEAFKRFALAEDLARGAGIDLTAASKLLGKANEENVNVLKRLGVNLKEGATEADLFRAVFEKFGGQAAAYAKTAAGRLDEARIRMDEFKEAIGKGVLPALTALVDFGTTKVFPFFEKLADAIGPKLAVGIGQIQSFIAVLKGGEADPQFEASFLGKTATFIRDQVIPTLKSGADEAKRLKDLFVLGFEGGNIGGERSGLEKLAFALGQTLQNDVIPWLVEANTKIDKLILGLNGGDIGGERSRLETAVFNLGKAIREDLLEPGERALKWLDDYANKSMSAEDRAKAHREQMKLLGDIFDAVAKIANDTLIAAIETVTDALNGGKAAVDAFVSVLHTLEQAARDVARALSEIRMPNLPNLPSLPHPFDLIPHKASGGPASGWSLVGERGPELVNFPSGSHVFSNGQSAAMVGARNTTINVNINGAIYGWADFKNKVSEAIRDTALGGGFSDVFVRV